MGDGSFGRLHRLDWRLHHRSSPLQPSPTPTKKCVGKPRVGFLEGFVIVCFWLICLAARYDPPKENKISKRRPVVDRHGSAAPIPSSSGGRSSVGTTGSKVSRRMGPRTRQRERTDRRQTAIRPQTSCVLAHGHGHLYAKLVAVSWNSVRLLLEYK